MEASYKYKAFISYRHKIPDKAVAVKLQKKLEGYRPPKAVAVKGFKKWRLFRDVTELQASSDLGEKIKDALRNSEYLIVICTEALKDSKWCKDEIEFFKELHNGSTDKIIAVVASGKPEDVVPEILRTRKIKVLSESGEVTFEEKISEPLAANITDENGKISFGKLNEEYLRIASVFLDCDYDDLYRRNQKRVIKRVVIIGAAILMVLLAFGIFATAMMINLNLEKERAKAAEAEAIEQMEIANAEKERAEAAEAAAVEQMKIANAEKERADENSREAESQKQIADKNAKEAQNQKNAAEKNAKEAQNQKNEAEKNMKTAMENEAKANEANKNLSQKSADVLTREAKSLLSDGKRTEAVKSAMEAINMQKNAGVLVSGESQQILSDAICAYKDYNFTTKKNIKFSNWIDALLYKKDSNHFIAYDDNTLYSVDFKTGQILKEKEVGYLGLAGAKLEGDFVYVMAGQRIYAYDYENLELLTEYEKANGSFNGFMFSPDKSMIAMCGRESIAVYSKDGKKIKETSIRPIEGKHLDATQGTLSDDGYFYAYDSIRDNILYAVNLSSDESLQIPLNRDEFFISMLCDDENIYVNLGTYGKGSSLVCLSRTDFSEKWSVKYSDEYGSSTSFDKIIKHKKNVILLCDDEVAVINCETGELVLKHKLTDHIEGFIGIEEQMLMIFTSYGKVECSLLNGDYTKYYSHGEDIRCFVEASDGKAFAVVEGLSSEALLYKTVSEKNEYAKTILPADKNSRDVVMYAYNGDGIVAFVRQSNYSDEYNVIVYDIKNSKVISEFKQKLHEKNTNHIDFCGKDRFVLCDDYYGIVYMYDINGALLAKLDLNQAIRDMIGKFTKESFYGYKVVGKYLICSSTRHIVMVDISDGRLVMSGVFDGGTFDINSAGYGVFSMNDGFAYGRLGAELSYITDKENILPVNEYISEMKISEGGNIMAFIRYENLYVYNRKTKELKTRIFNNYEKQPENITITPDEKYIIAVASDNKEIQKISVADLSTVSSLMSDKTFVYTKFEFLSESDLVISDVGDMLIVDCENMQIRADLPDGGFFIKEDNTVITSGYNKDILMYKYLTLDELMVKAEEFLVKYGN